MRNMSENSVHHYQEKWTESWDPNVRTSICPWIQQVYSSPSAHVNPEERNRATVI